MGVETGLMIALGATAVASAAGTAATNINNRKNVEETNAMSERLAQQNMEWQTAENAKNRAFNAQQAELASQRQYDNLASLFDRSANYYNPIEVVKRLKEAGLNPAAYFSGAGSQMVQGGTPSATQASYNSGLSPVMPNFTAFQRPDPHIASTAADVMSKLAGAKRDISDSNLLGSQKEALDGTWRATLDKLKADTRTSEIANYFQEIYGHSLNQNAVKEGVNRIALLSEQAVLAREQGNTEKTQQALNQITGEMRKMEGSFHGEMAKNVKLQNETFMDKFNAYLDNVESSTAKNRADAALSAEETNRIKSLLPDEIKLTRYNVGETAVNVLRAWEEYKNVKLTDTQRKLLTEKITQNLQHEVNQHTGQQFNPLRYVAWSLDPLAEEIGIALGGSATTSFTNKVKKP